MLLPLNEIQRIGVRHRIQLIRLPQPLKVLWAEEFLPTSLNLEHRATGSLDLLWRPGHFGRVLVVVEFNSAMEVQRLLDLIAHGWRILVEYFGKARLELDRAALLNPNRGMVEGRELGSWGSLWFKLRTGRRLALCFGFIGLLLELSFLFGWSCLTADQSPVERVLDSELRHQGAPDALFGGVIPSLGILEQRFGAALIFCEDLEQLLPLNRIHRAGI